MASGMSRGEWRRVHSPRERVAGGARSPDFYYPGGKNVSELERIQCIGEI